MTKSLGVRIKAEEEPVESRAGNEQEEEESEEEDEDEEEEEEDEEEEESEEEEEEEEEKEVPKKRKRCVRKVQMKLICMGEEEDEEEEEGEDEESEGNEKDEEEEDENAEEMEESEEVSPSSSILSAFFFQFENELYEFEELCDPERVDFDFNKTRTKQAFFNEPAKARYFNLCKALSITPMLWFLKAMDTEEVNLNFRQVNGKVIRSMCAAMEINTVIERLIFGSCKLTPEDCYYIGLMLSYNEAMKLLDLTGCRIGPEGVEKLAVNLMKNEALEELNLSKCYIEDEGLRLLAPVFMRPDSTIKKLDVSYNRLNGEAGEILTTILKATNNLTHLNLRYNYLYEPEMLKEFFRGLALNSTVTDLDLAWNGLNGDEIAGYISSFLQKNQTILSLDLSDNRFQGPAILKIRRGLARSKSLEVLKLGKNPLTAEDLELLLAAVKYCPTLKVLDLEELWVNKSFMKTLKKIQAEREFEVKLGGIYGNYEINGPDYAKIIFQRAEYEAKKPKKKKMKKDFGHLIWSLGDDPLTEENFMKKVKKFRAKVSKELIAELMAQFPASPPPPKGLLVDVKAMREKYLTIFPDSTPPPPPKVKPKKKKKGKKAKEKKPVEEKKDPKKKVFDVKEMLYKVANQGKADDAVTAPAAEAEKQVQEEEEEEDYEYEYDDEYDYDYDYDYEDEDEDEEEDEDEDEDEEDEEDEEYQNLMEVKTLQSDEGKF